MGLLLPGDYMLDTQIIFTYRELIEAFNQWNSVLDNGDVPKTPPGTNAGEMFTNYLIEVVNKIRADRLTSYNK
jgi:hypothetical protein